MLLCSSPIPFRSLLVRLVLTLCLCLPSLGATPWALAASPSPAQSSSQSPPAQSLSTQAQPTGAKDAAHSTASSQKKKAQNAKSKTAPHASARHMGAALGAGTSWYLDGAPQAGRGAVWERGIPMENLSRKRILNPSSPSAAQVRALGREQGTAPASAPAAQGGTVTGKGSPVAPIVGTSPAARVGSGGVDTTRGIDSALGEISSYERQPADGSALGLKKPGAPALQMTTEESSWRNPVTQPHTGGQDVMTSRRNVVGAYADVVKSEDLHVTLGPELHIPEADPTVKHLSPQQSESSALGFGMKWQWDF